MTRVTAITTQNIGDLKLSDLLLCALNDLRACEDDPNYRISMGEWHLPLQDGTCGVCLAGAVMAQSLKTSYAGIHLPSNFNYYIRVPLEALDQLRRGYLVNALVHQGYDYSQVSGIRDRKIAYYDEDPQQFFADLGEVYETLYQAGY